MDIISSYKKISLLFIITFMFLASFSASAEGERHIHINGEHLDLANIQLLDQVVGSPVGDGFYWLNLKTGQWGIEGNNQVQGVIASIANQASYPNQQSEQENSFNAEADRYNDWEGVDSNGGVVSGTVNGQNCTYVSVAGMTMKDCN